MEGQTISAIFLDDTKEIGYRDDAVRMRFIQHVHRVGSEVGPAPWLEGGYGESGWVRGGVVENRREDDACEVSHFFLVWLIR